jgi:hypothetical protein
MPRIVFWDNTNNEELLFSDIGPWCEVLRWLSGLDPQLYPNIDVLKEGALLRGDELDALAEAFTKHKYVGTPEDEVRYSEVRMVLRIAQRNNLIGIYHYEAVVKMT